MNEFSEARWKSSPQAAGRPGVVTRAQAARDGPPLAPAWASRFGQHGHSSINVSSAATRSAWGSLIVFSFCWLSLALHYYWLAKKKTGKLHPPCIGSARQQPIAVRRPRTFLVSDVQTGCKLPRFRYWSVGLQDPSIAVGSKVAPRPRVTLVIRVGLAAGICRGGFASSLWLEPSPAQPTNQQ
ncbi:hypothetical protein VTN96DRAFT_5933 [Rasamsonia emersonii]